MASFTDEIQKFNPYIQQVPVDDYLRAELYKQGKYDAGVQAVQSYMDAVTGLDVDPKYKDILQQASSSLQSQVKKVVSADFSNMQLVNQIGSAASRIAKDKTIQAGINSAANRRAQEEARKQAQKDGKSSVENDAYLDYQYSEWLKDPDLNNPFNGKYVPYTDLNKKWLDIKKAIDPDGRLNDIPFETTIDASGKTVVNYKKLADVMVKRGIEGIEPSKIENAIRATMTPTDMQQLGISAWYQFRGVTPEQLAKHSYEKYTENFKQTQEALAEAKKQLGAARGNTAEHARLQAIVDDFTQRLDPNKGSLKINYENEVEAIKANPEQAKTEIYKNGFISQFSNAFSWKKEKLEYTDSPFTKVAQWNKDFALRMDTNQLAHSKFAWDQQQDLFKNDLDTKKYILDYEKIHPTGAGFSTNIGTDVSVPSPVVAMTNDSRDLEEKAKGLRSDLKERLNGISDADLEERLNKYMKGDKKVFGADLINTVDEVIKSTAEAAAIQRVIDDKTAKARAKVYRDTPTADELLKGHNLLSIDDNGRKVVFSPKEVYDYLTKEKTQLSTGYEKGDTKRTVVIDPNLLSDKERILAQHLAGRYKNSGMSSGDRVLDSYIAKINPVISQTQVNEEKVNEELNKSLLKNNAAWVPRIETINTPTKETRETMEADVSALLTRFRSDTGGNKGSNIDDLEEWMGKEKERNNLTYMHFNQGGKEQLWVRNGSKVAKIDLTPREASLLPTKEKVDLGVQAVQKRLDLGGGNTNVSSHPDDAIWRTSDFKGVKKIMVTGDLQRELNGNGVFLNLNIKTPTGWKNVQSRTPLDIKTAQGYISTAKDYDIIMEAVKSAREAGDDDMADEILKALK
jgi:hypothetical protein